MFCGNCGKELQEGSNFCSGCGRKVGSVGQVPKQDSKNDKKLVIKLTLFAGYIVSFLLFTAKWFESPVMGMFSSEDVTFSFLDIAAVGLKTGEFFEMMNMSMGAVLAKIPFTVKVLAVIFGAMYIINMILLVVAAARVIVEKPIFKTQLGALISSLVSVVSAFVVVVIFQKYVDDYMGAGLSVGENLLTVTWQLIVLIFVLVAMLTIIFYAYKKDELKPLVYNKTTDSVFYMLGRFPYIKQVQFGVELACVVALVAWIVSAIIGTQKHSAGWTTDEISQDKINVLQYTQGTYTLQDELEEEGKEADGRIAFHIDEADGVFTLWNLNVYDDHEEEDFMGNTVLYASKNVDMTLYVVYPNGTIYSECPVGRYDDKDYCWADTVNISKSHQMPIGEYKIIVVCDNVKDVDIVLDYHDVSYSSYPFYFNMYYPGQYYSYYQ